MKLNTTNTEKYFFHVLRKIVIFIYDNEQQLTNEQQHQCNYFVIRYRIGQQNLV